MNPRGRNGGGGLELRGYQLRELPKEIGALTNLESLYLDNNQLRELPEAIGQLRGLARLYLDNNQFRELPEAIGQLTNLASFSLSGNQFRELPKAIGRLTGLTRLYLDKNKLRELPDEMRQFSKLEGLYLHDNPELGIPDSVLGSTWLQVRDQNATPASPKAILDYYFRMRAEGGAALNEVKLLLVGRGEAGKTSLSLQLRKGEFVAGQAETPGIAIEPWVVRCDGRTVKVHMWDFAGQEITHETHRFFLTERSMYVVVLDGRGGQQMEEAEYWLEHVKKFGATKATDGSEVHSPVVVVLNKWKTSGPYDVERRRLQREYPNIRAFVETDCKAARKGEAALGIEKLKATLASLIEGMDDVKREWPRSYQRVREALAEQQKTGKHFLSWAEYRAVCTDNAVPKDEEQELLAQNLNALGVALYYGNNERLRDTRVLTPDWVANGLYAIIRGVARTAPEGKHGQLLKAELGVVLAAGLQGMDGKCAALSHYPESTWPFLLELLVDRELAFPMPEQRDLFLLPALLPLDEPENFDVAAHLEGAEVKFRYVYDLLPAGVMSRFIVRTHTLSSGQARWQRGVVLEWAGARALLLAERRRNPRVDVFVRGGSEQARQQLAGIVRSNMQDIHHGLPEGMRGREELDLSLAGEQFVEVQKLVRMEQAGERLQVELGTGRTINVSTTKELAQVQPASARTEDAPKLRLFVSYAHEEHSECEELRAHLSLLENEGLLSWWQDSKLVAGDKWDKEIRREVAGADVLVLLVSNDFFLSKYIESVELAEARRRHEAGEAVVVPILVHDCPSFSRHRWLKTLQGAPTQAGRLRSVSSFRPQRNGWNLVQEELRKVIAALAGRRR